MLGEFCREAAVLIFVLAIWIFGHIWINEYVPITR